ncbi:hypothetical protein ONZ45_g2172 [Pleurotus djamor]|nr:hypothetical protein ONZ45_g2172 [Pleurotus djamor]
MSQPSLNTADTFERPPSIRSVASASSLGRRSRIRARSNTVIGGPSTIVADEGTPKSNFLAPVPGRSQRSTSSTTSSPTMNVRSVGGTHTTGLGEGVDSGSSQMHHEEDNTLVVSEQQHLENAVAMSKTKLHKAAVQAAALSRINTQIKPPPSAFSRVPITPRNGSNIRDSINSLGTRISTTSSSLYPPSTSTASGTESPPSPRSLAEQVDDHAISSYDPEVDEDTHAFDGDDVSYRLRLLVKNSYFLPPAHAKPTPSDFASSQPTPKKASRNPTPNFLDIFRVGKSKSKPPSPDETQNADARVPVLRTTGESVTLGAYPSRHAPRSNPAVPLRSPMAGQKPPDLSARVVVVREKMHDLATAAKQSEQEMKTRGARRDEESPQPPKVDPLNVIDPTDAVDLPPPSNKYGFAAQASALHGLGVQESVGAALLADRLPPPMSPDISLDADDRNWRKALLHAAVGHSLDNTPDVSTSSMSPEPLPSPWTRSPLASPPISRTQTPSMKRALGQRIISQPLIEIHDEHLDNPPHQSTPKKYTTLAVDISNSRRSSYFPVRAETPADPQTPLAPPPRRNIINPLYSLSQTDLAEADSPPKGQGTSQDANHTVDIRSTLSSPELSETYESARLMVMTPPPAHMSVYSGASIFATPAATEPFKATPSSSVASSIMNAETAESHYSDDDDQEDDYDHSRPVSVSMSAPTDGRPSLSVSEYSQPSPTVSAFQDALTGDDYHSAVSSFNQPWRSSDDQHSRSTSRDSPAPRYSTMSPPPRASSSLAPYPLAPPPRSLYQAVHQVRPPLVQQQSFLDLGEPSPTTPETIARSSTSQPPPPTILAPEPITPPFPIAERRGHTPATPLTLRIPDEHIEVSIHSAPAPSSPTSFFDSIQSQPNAMDDLESSSDEESEDESEEDDDDEADEPFVQHNVNPFHGSRARTISTATVKPAGRPSFMRLGNHSSPHIARTMTDPPSLPIGNVVSRKPVSNIPNRLPFFADRKSSKTQIPSSPYELATKMGSAEDLFPSSTVRRRPATADQTPGPIPYDTQDEDVAVSIERDHIVAGVRGQPPILKGKVYSGVDTANSVWMLEPRPRPLRLSARERTTSSISTATSSTQSSYAFVSDADISSSFAASLDSAQISDAEEFTVSPAPRSPTLSSAEERSTSIAQHGVVILISRIPPYHTFGTSIDNTPGEGVVNHMAVTDFVFDMSHELEHRYNMDPTSLVLIALELYDIRKDKEEAFEYFVRAWHQAHIPTSVIRLVNNYVPLPSSFDLPLPTEQAQRGTTTYYVQCIGGAEGLASLYVEAGLLHLEGTASSILSTSYSSLSSLRVPQEPQSSEAGANAWRRDREIASKYFERARSLHPTLEIPSLPSDAVPLPRATAGGDELLMPSIYLQSDDPASRQSSSPATDVSTPVIRRRRAKEENEDSLFDPNAEAEVDNMDNTWYLYIPGLVGAGTALLVVGVVHSFLPHLIKGDLDSARPEVVAYYSSQGVPVIQDHDQNSTDLMKCVAALTELENETGCAYDLIILGGLSGRLDQTIHTMSYMHKLRKQRDHVYVVTDDSVGWVLDSGEHTIDVDHDVLGPTCGLLPVGIEGTVLSTKGLRWNLSNSPSSFDGMVSTSNHLVPAHAQVWVKTSKPIWWTAEIRRGP